MALINCPECGKEISNIAKSCPNCGHKIKKIKTVDFEKKAKTNGILCIICLVLSVVLAVCLILSIVGKIGRQEDFLNSMALGINNRIAKDNPSDMTYEDQMRLFKELVEIEIAEIEKYENVKFSDETFNSLAHSYISACKSQKFAVENYKNEQIYNALWNGGYNIRAGIIVEMYEKYNLPITAEQVNKYRVEEYSSIVEDEINNEISKEIDNAINSSNSKSAVEEAYGVEAAIETPDDDFTKELVVNDANKYRLYKSNELDFVLNKCIYTEGASDFRISLSVANVSDSIVTITLKNPKLDGVPITMMFEGKTEVEVGSFETNLYVDLDTLKENGLTDFSEFTCDCEIFDKYGEIVTRPLTIKRATCVKN